MTTATTIPATAKHTATLIFAHGLGDSGSGWTFLAEWLRRQKVCEHVKFVFPNAPIQPVTINGGMTMPSWFDVYELGSASPSRRTDDDGIRQSAGRLQKLISEEVENGIDPSRIVVGGFSQGCAIGLFSGLTYERKLGGIIGLSGFLPMATSMKTLLSDANKATPVFIGHGTNDGVLPYALAERSRDTLNACLEFPVDFHSYAGVQHAVCPEELNDLSAFLQKAIP